MSEEYILTRLSTGNLVFRVWNLYFWTEGIVNSMNYD